MAKPPQEAIDIIESMALNDQKIQHQRRPPPRQCGMLELNSADAVLAQQKLLQQQLEEQQHKWILNATASGQLMAKPPQEAIDIIESMALNDQKIQHQRRPPPRQCGMLELNSADAVLAQQKLLQQQLEEQQHKWILNATASGQLMAKPPQEAIDIIESMALNDQKIQHQRRPPPRQCGMLELNSADAVLAQQKLLQQQLEEVTHKLNDLPK
ncbi:PREDICTED: uncharacterized protein LOC109361850 [Lupinus angustifolius]|uniref:uncharacterized protein LOC109361850 n=1 Tax=Lupinus angustifolius TaxID=3871 RepID=UPI00092F9C9F|nr:PREDICTED: uncharacterized protein LOC109361850 [Lupinus angustifolius]